MEKLLVTSTLLFWSTLLVLTDAAALKAHLLKSSEADEEMAAEEKLSLPIQSSDTEMLTHTLIECSDFVEENKILTRIAKDLLMVLEQRNTVMYGPDVQPPYPPVLERTRIGDGGMMAHDPSLPKESALRETILDDERALIGDGSMMAMEASLPKASALRKAKLDEFLAKSTLYKTLDGNNLELAGVKKPHFTIFHPLQLHHTAFQPVGGVREFSTQPVKHTPYSLLSGTSAHHLIELAKNRIADPQMDLYRARQGRSAHRCPP